MNTIISNVIREHIHTMMAALPIPDDVVIERREDGIDEFNRHWCVRGDFDQGLFASYTDRDDLIEFGLLERSADQTINVLHVTLILDDDETLMHCFSEFDNTMNFDAKITPQHTTSLDKAIQFFARSLG